jgi:RNA polymerase sigma-70 factor (ECF subfamily)
MPDQSDDGFTDEALVRRFQGGDRTAFEGLVVRHRAAIYRIAHRMTGEHGEADDLTQESFLRAYRSLTGFRGEARFRTWLVRILLNLARNVRQSRRPTTPMDEVDARFASSGGAHDAALKGEVRQAVESLPPRQREVLILKAYEGMKFIEIADAAGMSVGTAKATFFQAVQGLRRRLGRNKDGSRRDEVGA